MQDAVEHGIAQVDVAGGHVNPGAQHASAVLKLAGLHAAKQIEVFVHRAVAERAVLARFRQRAACEADLLLRLIVDIGMAGLDQALRPVIEPVEIIRGVIEVGSPVVAEPVHVGLDGIDIFLLFLGRIGVVEAQMAAPGKFLRDAKIKGNRLGVADMQIAVRLGWKSRHDPAVFFGVEVGLDDVADKIAPRLCRYRFCDCHYVFLVGSSRPSAKFAPARQAYFAYGEALVMHRSCYTPPPFTPQPHPMTDSVVTRFAPSPTGFLHIGGARTALFNWLYAKKRGGKMLLRIEDTDRERSTKEAIDAILDGLKWLGLDWDGEVIYQFSRAARHREVAEQLLASGKAYRCYATQEELTAMREKARAEGRTRLYDGLWRDRDASEAPSGLKPTIRLRAPQTGETVIEDQVQGRVVWQNENLDDLVLLRGDGNPTYMLAVVVDDHDMA